VKRTISDQCIRTKEKKTGRTSERKRKDHLKNPIIKDTPGGPFKLIDDGSFMDVDDQTNSNHASNVDGDEHQSNHLNLDTANSSNSINNNTNNNLNSPSVPNRNNNSRVSRISLEEGLDWLFFLIEK
jgi:hypothetical protein